MITILIAEAFVDLDIRRGKYNASIKKIKDNTNRSVGSLKKKWGELNKAIDKNAKSIRDFGAAALGMGAAVGASMGLLTRSFISGAVEMEKMMKGLTSVAGGAQAAQEQLKEFREVAKLPGLGLGEVVKAAINLQAVRFSAEKATFFISEMGNALATVGKGRQDLEGVIRGMQQMQSRGKVLAEEINQISERVPQFRAAMLDAFGTATSEEIQKLGITVEEFLDRTVAELAKLPRVAGGTANAIENLTDSWTALRVELGNELLPVFTKVIDALAGTVSKLNELSSTQKRTIAWSVAVTAAIGLVTAALGGLTLAAPGAIAGIKAIRVLLVGLPALAPIASGLVGVGAGFAAVAAGIKLFDAARQRGKADVSEDIKRRDESVARLKAGIEKEAALIKRLNESITKFGPHKAWQETLDRSVRRLEGYRKEVDRLGGDIFGILEKRRAGAAAAAKTGLDDELANDLKKLTDAFNEASGTETSGALGFLDQLEKLPTTAARTAEAVDRISKMIEDMEGFRPEPTSFKRQVLIDEDIITFGDISPAALKANKQLSEFSKSVKVFGKDIGESLRAIFVPVRDADFFARILKESEERLARELKTQGEFGARSEELTRRDNARIQAGREELTALEKTELEKATAFFKEHGKSRERATSRLLKRLTQNERDFFRVSTNEQKRFTDMTFEELAEVRDIWARAGNEIGSGWKAALIDIGNRTVDWRRTATDALGIVETAFQDLATGLLKDIFTDDFEFSWKAIWSGLVDAALEQIGRLIGSAVWAQLLDGLTFIKTSIFGDGAATAAGSAASGIISGGAAATTGGAITGGGTGGGLLSSVSNAVTAFASVALPVAVVTGFFVTLGSEIKRHIDFQKEFNRILEKNNGIMEASTQRGIGGVGRTGIPTRIRTRATLPTTFGNIKAGLEPGFELGGQAPITSPLTGEPAGATPFGLVKSGRFQVFTRARDTTPPVGFTSGAGTPTLAPAGGGQSNQPVTINLNVNAQFPNADLRSVTQATWDNVFNEKLINSFRVAITENRMPELITV